MGHRQRPQGPPGPLHGDQPEADHRPDLPEDPHPRIRLDLPVLGEDGGFKEGLCGKECTYNKAEAKKLIDEGGGIPGGQLKISYNADTGSHKEWVNAVCNSINNVMGNNQACVGGAVGTFADFRNQVSTQKMTGPWRAGWQMDYPLIQNFLQPLYYTNAPSNDGKSTNQDFDDLVDKANAETDKAKAITRPGRGEGPRRADAVHPALVPERQRGLLGAGQQRGAEPVQRAGLHGDHGQLTR
ncbi:hypothetical protein SMICM17S_09810 [Streptomyces microflavus]